MPLKPAGHMHRYSVAETSTHVPLFSQLVSVHRTVTFGVDGTTVVVTGAVVGLVDISPTIVAAPVVRPAKSTTVDDVSAGEAVASHRVPCASC